MLLIALVLAALSESAAADARRRRVDELADRLALLSGLLPSIRPEAEGSAIAPLPPGLLKVMMHVASTNPHGRVRPERDAFVASRFQDWAWPDPPMLIWLDDPRLEEVHAASRRDVRRYAARITRGETPPAVVLGNEGRRFAILDGAHRIEAARQAGLDSIQAFVGVRWQGLQERLRMEELGPALLACLDRMEIDIICGKPQMEWTRWTCGPCWIVADALVAWSGARLGLYAVIDDGAYGSQHVLVGDGTWFLDGHGASRSKEAIIATVDGGEGFMRMDPDEIENATAWICRDMVASLRLERELDRCLGPVGHWLVRV